MSRAGRASVSASRFAVGRDQSAREAGPQLFDGRTGAVDRRPRLQAPGIRKAAGTGRTAGTDSDARVARYGNEMITGSAFQSPSGEPAREPSPAATTSQAPHNGADDARLVLDGPWDVTSGAGRVGHLRQYGAPVLARSLPQGRSRPIGPVLPVVVEVRMRPAPARPGPGAPGALIGRARHRADRPPGASARFRLQRSDPVNPP